MGVVKEVIRCVTLHVNGVPFLFQGMILFCEVVSIGLDLGQSEREFVQCFPQWTSLRERVSRCACHVTAVVNQNNMLSFALVTLIH